MSQPATPQEIMPVRAYGPDPLSTVKSALLFLAGKCDGARRRDAHGFSAADAKHGKHLAEWVSSGRPLSRDMAEEALAICRKYQETQLAAAGIRLPAAVGRRAPAAPASLPATPAPERLKRYVGEVAAIDGDPSAAVLHFVFRHGATGKQWRCSGRLPVLPAGRYVGAKLAMQGRWKRPAAAGREWEFEVVEVECMWPAARPSSSPAATPAPAAAPAAAGPAARPSSSPAAQRLKGRISRLLAGPWADGVAVFELLCETGRTAKVKGAVPGATTRAGFEGRRVEAFGTYRDVPSHGRTFLAFQVKPLVEMTVPGLAGWFESLRTEGVGPATSGKIAEALSKAAGGARPAYERLMKDPSWVCSLEGFDAARLGRLRDALRIQAAADAADPEVVALLVQLGLSPTRVSEVVSRFGERAAAIAPSLVELMRLGLHQGQALSAIEVNGEQTLELVRQDPYRLMDSCEGIGFATADKIALSLGIAVDATVRLSAAARHVLESSTDFGHCYLHRARLLSQMQRLINVPHDRIEAGIDEALKTGKIIDDRGALYAAKILAAEKEVAASCVRRAGMKAAEQSFTAEQVAAWEARNKIKLAPQQIAGVTRSAVARLLVITGGPGTGKSSLTRAAVELLTAQGRKVGLAAPTGRAARRLSEATGRQAHTIHRILNLRGASGGTLYVSGLDVLICDEFSMVDLLLTQSVLRAVPETASLILIGDVDQLPSIGPGAVLRDLIASGVVEVIRLTQVFRQAEGSLIVQFAHRINRGDRSVVQEIPVWAPGAAPPVSGHMAIWEPARPTDSLTEMAWDALSALHTQGFAPHDCLVLSPQRGSGQADDPGVNGLNALLQQRYNPGGRPVRAWSNLRVGDRVLNSHNDYEGKGVRNGDLGYVDALVEEGPNKGQVRVRFDDDRVVYYEDGELSWLTLGYAMTVHKAQGGQARVLIIVATEQHRYMLRRGLFYTGVTRGVDFVVILGARAAVDRAIRTGEAEERNTKLSSRMQERAA